jgi:hypothetical protein
MPLPGDPWHVTSRHEPDDSCDSTRSQRPHMPLSGCTQMPMSGHAWSGLAGEAMLMPGGSATQHKRAYREEPRGKE